MIAVYFQVRCQLNNCPSYDLRLNDGFQSFLPLKKKEAILHIFFMFQFKLFRLKFRITILDNPLTWLILPGLEASPIDCFRDDICRSFSADESLLKDGQLY